MRHATSWRKNQSGDDAFNRLFQSSLSTNIIDIRFSYLSYIQLPKPFQTSLILYYQPISFDYFLNNMQQLANDTSSWNLIVAPSPSSVSLYNSNTYDTIVSSSTTNNNTDHSILPIVSLVSTQTAIIESNSVNYWAFILIIFPLFTIFGNILVVLSVYREKSLHTVTNYFVVSLAISDITVAAVVMPFAIYLEYNRIWELSERLCDFWVAADCMACTASILNLVAIAVDRYIAVTKPLKYARHKSPKRVAIMIVIVWLISFLIALPIVSGVNKSDVPDYPRVPEQCEFFNNKFLIFSSLGSFFIPCIIIFAIYYRIFMVIMAQARKTRKQWRPKAVIESAAAQHRSNADNLITSYYHEKQSTANPVSIVPEKTSLTLPIDSNETALNTRRRSFDLERNSLMLKLSTPVLTPLCFPPAKQPSSSGEQNEEIEPDETVFFLPHGQTNGKKTTDQDNQIEILALDDPNPLKTKNCSSQTDNNTDGDNHLCNKRFKARLKNKSITNSSAITAAVQTSSNNVKTAKRKAYSRMKKERKATQTLIIVLICFLVCWLPFFVLNNLVNAIVKLSRKSNAFLINNFILSLCVWLGYINSFLNPIIYTIFNLEFRKAFVKILFSSCRTSSASSSIS